MNELPTDTRELIAYAKGAVSMMFDGTPKDLISALANRLDLFTAPPEFPDEVLDRIAGEVRTSTYKESPVGGSKSTPVRFSADQVQQVQEAIRRAERDMTDWREKSRVDPEKLFDWVRVKFKISANVAGIK